MTGQRKIPCPAYFYSSWANMAGRKTKYKLIKL
nr:MAG TPA: hypothetical protein [Caudoviricetes sp.]